MIKGTSIFLIAFSFCQVTLASQGLVGSWKQEKVECKTGAIYQEFVGGYSGSILAQVTFSETTMNTFLQANIKYDAAKGEALLKQIEDSKKQVELMPESPMKEKFVSDLEKGKDDLLAIINKFKDGYSCQLDTAGPYNAIGSELSAKLAILKNTCEGATIDQISDAQFEVNGDTLVVIAQPESQEGKSCPKGDSKITTFSRIN